MCSTCDCDKNQLTTTVRPEASEADKPQSSAKCCRKCGAEPYIVLDKVHIECRTCFLESCNRKVRSTIGKSKLLRNNDSILIAHSGGPSSTALLSLIKNSNEYDARREQKFRPSILHIDTRAILGFCSDDEWDERENDLKTLLESTRELYPDWPLYWSTLEMSSSSSKVQAAYVKFDPLESLRDPKFDAYLRNRKAYEALREKTAHLDLTDRQRFEQDCISELINNLATSISSTNSEISIPFKFVFTASSATQLANNLLVDVILGQGATIRSTVNVCDSRPTIPTVRPMRDFSKKEIAFYLKAKNLQSHAQRNLSTFADRKASIQTVTEAFLSKLYVDYPSTYSTLLRTGNKMQD